MNHALKKPAGFKPDRMMTLKMADGGYHKGSKDGGRVTGPGGPVADKVPAMYSNGEYVLPADTAKHIGYKKLDAIKDATHTPAAAQRMGFVPGMANGGALALESIDPAIAARAAAREAATGEYLNPKPKPAPASNYVSPGVGGRDPFAPQAPAPASTAPGVISQAREALNRANPASPAIGGRVAQGAKSLASGAARLAGRVATPLAVGMEGYDVAKVAADPNASGIDVATQVAQGAGRLGAAGAGAAIGAALGSAVPVVGTAIGGLAGGALGYFGADKVIEAGRRAVGVDPAAPASRAPGLLPDVVAPGQPAPPARPFKDPRIPSNPGTIAEQAAAMSKPNSSGAPDAAGDLPTGQVNVTRQPNGVMSFSGKDITGDPQYTGVTGFKSFNGGVSSLGGPIAPSAASQAALTNPDGSRWTAQDNAIMAANLRDGIDPYRGTSRQVGGGLLMMGQTGGFGILSDAYEERRAAAMPLTSTTASKAEKASAAAAVQAIDARGLQGVKESGDTARARMNADTARRGQDATTNEFARQRLGFDAQRVANETQKAAGDQTIQGFQVRAAERLDSAQKTLLDPAATPEQRKLAQSTLAALSGKTATDRMQVINLPDAVNESGQTVRGGQALIRMREDGTVEQVPVGAQQAKPAAKAYPEGTRLTGPDGKTYVVKNGIPAPI